jgi:hypothetical protein
LVWLQIQTFNALEGNTDVVKSVWKLIRITELSRLNVVSREILLDTNKAIVELDGNKYTLEEFDRFYKNKEFKIFRGQFNTGMFELFIAKNKDIFSDKQTYRHFLSELQSLKNVHSAIEKATSDKLSWKERHQTYDDLRQYIDREAMPQKLDYLISVLSHIADGERKDLEYLTK